MSNHTPGPWKASHIGTSWHALSQSGYVIATLNAGGAYKASHESNARLIAAAPDMLEALRDLLDYAVDRAQFTPENLAAFIDAGSLALAQAEGRDHD